MRNRLAHFAMLFVAWFAANAGSTLHAQEAAGKSYAVIIGVGEFDDKEIKPRLSATADALEMYNLLTDKGIGGVAVDDVRLLLSGKQEKGSQIATKANILSALKEITSKATKDDKVYIVLIGQGAPSGDRTTIFGVDSTVKNRAKDAIFPAEIRQEFKALKSQQLCVLVDVNLKSFDPGKETVVEPNIFDLVNAFHGLDEKGEGEPPVGRAVILAGNGTNPPVLTDKKLGVFITAVSAGLRGAADKDGNEADSHVTVEELVKHLDAEVPNLARKFGTTREEKEQQPFTISRDGRFPLTRNPDVSAKSDERLKKFAEIAKQPKFTKEIAIEGERLLSRMPKLTNLQTLRKLYQDLADGTRTVDDFLTAREKIHTEMKLDDEAAKTYASKLMRALDRYKSNYIKELDLTDMVVNSIRGLYTRSDIKPTDELKAKLDMAKKLDKADLLDLLRVARLPLGKREDLEKDRDVEISIKAGIAKFVDPYTDYIDHAEVLRMTNETTGTFTGIGVQIRRDLARDALLVVTPIKGSPAYKAGIRAGDLITKVIREASNDGKEKYDPPKIDSTKGMRVTDAVKLILGEPDTKVKIEIEREGLDQPKVFEITRGRVETESVLGYQRKADDSWDWYIDPKSKIAYIHLTQFARKSMIDMGEAIKELEKDGVKGVILDLRFNPGGYLDVARDICDLFIDDGLIVSIKPRVEEPLEMFGKRESSHRYRDGRGAIKEYTFKSHTDFPMVCMINGFSASGSEILSACLQDHSRAVILGERSFGKGSVQNIEAFAATKGELKMTTATFWRPNGKNLNKSSTKGLDEEDWGVRPDKGYELKLTRQELDQLQDKIRDWANIPNRELKQKEPPKEFKDKQLEAAVEYLRAQLKVTNNIPRKK